MATVEDLQTKLDEALEKIKGLGDENKELANEARLFKNKFNLAQQEIEDSRHAVAQADAQIDSYINELNNIRRENRLLVKDKEELEEKLQAEVSSVEKLRQEWKDKEEELTTSLREQKTINKELNHQSQLQEAKEPPPPVLETADVIKLKEIIEDQDKHIAGLVEEVETLTEAKGELSKKLVEQELTHEKVRREIEQLRKVNDSLMEDAESYQILLEQRTMSGEFLNSAIMQSTDSLKGGFGSLADELHGTMSSTTYELKIAESQAKVTALTLYIEKILSHITKDDDILESMQSTLHRQKQREKTPRTSADSINGPGVEVTPPTSPGRNSGRKKPSVPQLSVFRSSTPEINTSSAPTSAAPKSASIMPPTSPFLQSFRSIFAPTHTTASSREEE